MYSLIYRFYFIIVLLNMYSIPPSLCQAMEVNKDSVIGIHNYIYLKKSKDFVTEFGHYKFENKRAIKEQSNLSFEAYKDNLVQEFNLLPKNKKNILVFIHGFMADNKNFVTTSTALLQKEIFDESKYGMVLSLQWEAKLIYSSSYEIAQEKGKKFAGILQDILSKVDGDYELSFFCHSMGHIVFSNLINATPQDFHPIKHLLFMAADLPDNALSEELSDKIKDISKVWIYYNNDDRTLQMANALKPYRRLGIYGPTKKEALPSNIILKDKTGLDDNENLPAKMSLHRYYYSSPSIRKEVLEILNSR
jgi:esterase/lipase superfamily enzyme